MNTHQAILDETHPPTLEGEFRILLHPKNPTYSGGGWKQVVDLVLGFMTRNGSFLSCFIRRIHAALVFNIETTGGAVPRR